MWLCTVQISAVDGVHVEFGGGCVVLDVGFVEGARSPKRCHRMHQIDFSMFDDCRRGHAAAIVLRTLSLSDLFDV